MPRESDRAHRVGNSAGEGQMDGVKALVVLASIYYPGDGIVAKN